MSIPTTLMDNFFFSLKYKINTLFNIVLVIPVHSISIYTLYLIRT